MPSPVSSLLLFGATGDLAKRMLLPSLFALHREGLISPSLTIQGAARSPLDNEGYRALAAAALTEFLPPQHQSADDIASFLQRLSYCQIDATDASSFARLRQNAARTDGGTAVFLSTAPDLFGPTIAGLRDMGLSGPQVRLALEKPLGHDLASSRKINDAVAAVFAEDQIFRIDHYLGKETVQNLLTLRFGNSLFEPQWNATGIEHVQITVSETIGVQGRGDFYDAAGALRDMVQNHMLQLLALVAMEPPATFNATAVRDEKVKVLRSLRRIDHDSVATHSVIGQYGEGAISGEPVRGYASDLGRHSPTETFVALKAHIDNWRWKGVPFYLRTGKRLPSRQSEIFIQFRKPPHNIFGPHGPELQPNKLVLRLQPEENVRLLVMVKEPGLERDGPRLRELPLDLSLLTAFSGKRRRIAYERLLLDLIEGDPTLFVRRDEVEAQWEWIDNIRQGWAAQGMQPRAYPAGSWGPSAAIALTERDHVSWHD